jgi:hypothetical protein
VRVSLVCFGQGDGARLNDVAVECIQSDLTVGNGESIDLTKAQQLTENLASAFIGTQKSGDFDIPGKLARQWLTLPNPHGRPNSDVVCPWANGLDIVRRSRHARDSASRRARPVSSDAPQWIPACAGITFTG